MKSEKRICFVLTEGHFNKLVQIAKKNYPNECVGLIFGNVIIKTTDNNIKKPNIIYKVKKIEEIISSKPSPVSFIIEDLELLAQKWFKAQQSGLKLISIFHSHPSDAYPSGKDRIYMKQLNEFWKIQNLLSKQFKSHENIINSKNMGTIWTIYGNKSKKLNAFILQCDDIFKCDVKMIN
ncbi:MAG: Mov34/MPN/PAD-1 family protein [Promethearchaeota archaeon]